jgi:histidinol phosphatase-like PHP family hydrolase
MGLTNTQIAELLLRAADIEPLAHRRTALQRAARGAVFWWPEEAAHIAASDRSLTELPAVGPWLARLIHGLLASGDFDDAPEPPPIRRGFLTLAEVRSTLAEHTDWRNQLRADLQMHTTYSDGKAPLREMVRTCADEYGYEHILITDHSIGLKIARGMDEATLAAESSEIAGINEELAADGARMRVLHGLEMNLSPEGEGDMAPHVLGKLDMVLGAFHSKLRITDDQTERYLMALRNPVFHVLAHPRGRRYNVRLGLSADWGRVVEEAVEQDKALEIDGFPDRQDLNVELLELARDAGVRISLGTDAHRPEELRYIEFSLAAAIRAGLSKDRILNFMPRDELLEWTSR